MRNRHPMPRIAGLSLLGLCVALGACAEPASPAAAAVASDAAVTTNEAAALTTSANPAALPAPTAPPALAPATAPEPAAARAEHTDHGVAPAASADARKSVSTHAVDASLPRVQVHKSPTCGCCSLWVDHMREHGFAVEVHDTHDLAAVKSRLGVPADAQSCHTAEVGGLVVEGHVPASDIKRALAQGDTRALVLPGMPINSPGMEVPGINAPPYTVERIKSDGTREPFATHGESAGER